MIVVLLIKVIIKQYKHKEMNWLNQLNRSIVQFCHFLSHLSLSLPPPSTGFQCFWCWSCLSCCWNPPYLPPVSTLARFHRLQVKLCVNVLHAFHTAVNHTSWRGRKDMYLSMYSSIRQWHQALDTNIASPGTKINLYVRFPPSWGNSSFLTATF